MQLPKVTSRYTDNPKYKKKITASEPWEISIHDILARQASVRRDPSGELNEENRSAKKKSISKPTVRGRVTKPRMTTEDRSKKVTKKRKNLNKINTFRRHGLQGGEDSRNKTTNKSR